MTYCLAINVKNGLVLAADSRTNAGVDHVATYRKMTSFVFPNKRVVMLLTSGSLATSQAVLHRLEDDLSNIHAKVDLTSGKNLHEVAQYVGKVSWDEQKRHHPAMEKSSSSAEASFILGGQIAGQACQAFLIYPQGNFIAATAETPYLQIGEHKYGKPILDRMINSGSSLEDAARCAMVSLDSTIRSNISVGPPIDLAIYRADELDEPFQMTMTTQSPMYKSLRKRWNQGLQKAFAELPRFDWED